MSIWTHIDGFINFNNSVSYGHITDFLGPQSVPGGHRYKDGRLPQGSEGSIRYDVGMLPYLSVGDVNYEGVTVGILGNLRDFNNLDSIEKWLHTIPSDFVTAAFVRDGTETDSEIFNDFVRNALIIATTCGQTKAWRWSLDTQKWEEIPWT